VAEAIFIGNFHQRNTHARAAALMRLHDVLKTIAADEGFVDWASCPVCTEVEFDAGPKLPLPVLFDGGPVGVMFSGADLAAMT
jgi:hypothetical protein